MDERCNFTYTRRSGLQNRAGERCKSVAVDERGYCRLHVRRRRQQQQQHAPSTMGSSSSSDDDEQGKSFVDQVKAGKDDDGDSPRGGYEECRQCEFLLIGDGGSQQCPAMIPVAGVVDDGGRYCWRHGKRTVPFSYTGSRSSKRMCCEEDKGYRNWEEERVDSGVGCRGADDGSIIGLADTRAWHGSQDGTSLDMTNHLNANSELIAEGRNDNHPHRRARDWDRNGKMNMGMESPAIYGPTEDGRIRHKTICLAERECNAADSRAESTMEAEPLVEGRTHELLALEQAHDRTLLSEHLNNDFIPEARYSQDGSGSDDASSWPRVVRSDVKLSCVKDFLAATDLAAIKELPCCVCSEARVTSKLVKVGLEEMTEYKELLQPSVTQQERLGNRIMLYGSPSLDGMVLDREGICLSTDGRVDGEGSFSPYVQVCSTCYSQLTSGKLPRLAMANDLFFGVCPSPLRGLSPVEQAFIAKYRCRVSIIKLKTYSHDPSSQQRAIRGNCITFPQNPSAALNAFPRSVDSVLDTVLVVFIGAQRPSGDILRQLPVLRVRRSKVREALLWLRSNNPLYAGIRIDDEVLMTLPENGILAGMLDSVSFINEDDDMVGQVDEAERAGYDNRRDGLNPVENYSSYATGTTTAGNDDGGDNVLSDVELELTGVVDSEAVVVRERDRLGAVVRSLRQDDRNPYRIMFPHGPDPACEFSNPELLPGMYPVLYPYGIGGPDDRSRRVHVDFHPYLKHLLLLQDRSFAQHDSFIFVTFNMLQRRRACSSVRVLMRQPHFSSIASQVNAITADEVVTVLEQGNTRGLYTGRLGTLSRQLRIAGGHVPGTVESKKRMRNEIRALSVYYGPPTFYITINPADIHSPIVLHYAGKVVPLDADERERIYPAILRARIVAANPVASARFFNLWIVALIKHVIGWGRAEGGILGHVEAYYAVIETQGRGSLHTHGVFYIKGSLPPLDVRQKMAEPNFSQQMFAYLSDVIKCDFSELQDLVDNVLPGNEINGNHRRDDEDEDMTISDNTSSNNIASCTADKNSTATCSTANPGSLHYAEINDVSDNMGPPRVSPVTTQTPYGRRARSNPHPSSVCPQGLLDISAPNASLLLQQPFLTNLLSLLNKVQIHSHSPTCYKHGYVDCRFDYPAPIVNRPYFDSSTGKIHLRRLHALVNPYNELLTFCARCNTDIKYIGANGNQSLAILYYITCYITKVGLTSHNAFAMAKASLEKVFVRPNNYNTTGRCNNGGVGRNAPAEIERPEECHPPLSPSSLPENNGTLLRTVANPGDEARRKILRCIISSCAQQEMSGPQVAALTLSIGNGGDHFTSHTFTTLCTTPLFNYLRHCDAANGLGTLLNNDSRHVNDAGEDDRNGNDEDHHDEDNSATRPTEEEFSLHSTGNGSYVTVNDRLDYIYRSDRLSSLPLYFYKSQFKKITLASEKKRVSSDRRPGTERTRRRQQRQRTTSIASGGGTLVAANGEVEINDGPNFELPEEGGEEGDHRQFDESSVREESSPITESFLNEYRGLGRRATNRYLFQPPHPQSKTHALRQLGEPLIPNILGRTIPRRDDTSKSEDYGTLILLLFKPWRTISDLKSPGQSWAEALHTWLQTTPNEGGPTPAIRKHINNLEYLKRSSDEAAMEAQERMQRPIRRDITPNEPPDHSLEGDGHLEHYSEPTELDVPIQCEVEMDYAEDSIDAVRNSLDELTRAWHDDAMQAVSFGLPATTRNSHHQNEQTSSETLHQSHGPHVTSPNIARYSTDQDVENLKSWRNTLKRKREEVLLSRRTPPSQGHPNGEESRTRDTAPPAILVRETATTPAQRLALEPTIVPTTHEALSPGQHSLLTGLTEYQAKAHNCFCNNGIIVHFRQCEDENKQLLACLLGEGGTGKTKTINAIVDYFCRTNMGHTLRVAAPTGCAAANISASTIHSIIQWRPGRKFSNEDEEENNPSTTSSVMESDWGNTTHLIIDEVSMIGCGLIYELHAYLCKAKRVSDRPFGGVSILFCGDFFQFPPVSDSPLYAEPAPPRLGPLNQRTINQLHGRRLWLLVDTVFILTEQLRGAGDPRLRRILANIRDGRCSDEDYNDLCSRIVGPDNAVDLSSEQWSNPTWIVTRNALRAEINDRAVQREASLTTQPLLYAESIDSWKNHYPLPRYIRRALSCLKDNQTENLSGELKLTPGCPVQLSSNSFVELGLVNGAQGIFRGLVYKRDETAIMEPNSPSVVRDCYTGRPIYALVEFPGNSLLPPLPGLPNNVIPIPPIKRSFQVKHMNPQTGRPAKVTITREQLPLTLAYCVTDYKVQGRTLTGKVVVDLRPPPRAKRNLVAIACYVALSRVTSLDNLAILRAFPVEALRTSPPPSLIQEMARLQRLEAQTTARAVN